MKKLILLFLNAGIITMSYSQIRVFSTSDVGIGLQPQNPPPPSAKLYIHSEDKGLLIPSMTKEQRDNITCPHNGLMVNVIGSNIPAINGPYYWRLLSGNCTGIWIKMDGSSSAPQLPTDLSFTFTPTTNSPVTINSSTGTDVSITEGYGISLSGTSNNMTITNFLPDQIISINGALGTYPNFSIPIANTTTTGLLTSTDWNTFNGKVDGNGNVDQFAYFNGVNSITSSATHYRDGANFNSTGNIDINSTSGYVGFRRVMNGLNHGVTNKLATNAAWTFADYSGTSYPNFYFAGVGKGEVPVSYWDLIRLDTYGGPYLSFNCSQASGTNTETAQDNAQLLTIANNGASKFILKGNGQIMSSYLGGEKLVYSKTSGVLENVTLGSGLSLTNGELSSELKTINGNSLYGSGNIDVDVSNENELQTIIKNNSTKEVTLSQGGGSFIDEIGVPYKTKVIQNISSAINNYNSYYELFSVSMGSLQGVFEIDLTMEGSGFGQSAKYEIPVSYCNDYLSNYSLIGSKNCLTWLSINSKYATPRHILPNANNWELQMRSINGNDLQFRFVLRQSSGENSQFTLIATIKHSSNFYNVLYSELFGTGSDATVYDFIPNILSSPKGSSVIQNTLLTTQVGINTATPSYAVDVNGNIRVIERTGTAATLAAYDTNGKLCTPTVGSGLSLTNGELSSELKTINGNSLYGTGNLNVGTVTDVTASSPLTSSGGATPNIAIPIANMSATGALSSADWNIFNNKIGSLSKTTTGSDFTITGSTINLPFIGTSSSVSLGFESKTNNNGVSIGVGAGTNTNGNFNVAVGLNAIRGALSNCTGYRNVGVGTNSLSGLTTGYSNVGVGTYSLHMNQSGSNNIGIGEQALFMNQSGSNNVGIGLSAGENCSGSNNTFVGSSAGKSVGSVSNCVYIGKDAGQNISRSNTLAIDNSNTSNPLFYGEFDNDYAKINGSFGVSTLAGTGTRIVVANSSGILSTQTLSIGTVTDVTAITPISVTNGTTSPQISLDNLGVTTDKIANNAVTYGKIQNVGGLSLLGNPNTTVSQPQEISIGTGLNFTGNTLNSNDSDPNPSNELNQSVSVVYLSGSTLPSVRISDAGGYLHGTMPLFSTTNTNAGVVPGSNGSTTSFLRGDGTWAAIPVGITSVLGTAPISVTTGASPQISLNDAGVTTGKLADNAVSNEKIADNAVTTIKINNSAVTTSKISDDAVTYAKIQDMMGARLLGNPATTASSPSEISLGTGLSFTSSILNTTLSHSGAEHKVAFWSGPNTLSNTTNFHWNNSSQRLGIGTATPSATLSVNGTIHGNFGTTANNGNLVLSNNAGNTSISGIYNFLFGPNAGAAITNGNRNIFMGEGAGQFTQSGYENIYIGYLSGRENVSGLYNVFLGKESGRFGNGSSNIFIGQQAGYNTSGNSNIFLGTNCGKDNTSGEQNVFIGINSGNKNIGASNNVFIGSSSGNANTIGQTNTFVGASAGLNNVGGSSNTALGYGAGPSSSTGGLTNATAIGNGAIVSADNTMRLGNNSLEVISTQTVSGFSTGSDERIKSNIAQDVPGVSFITKLNPVTFNYDANKTALILNIPDSLRDFNTEKIQNSILRTGFIAQEVEHAAKSINYDFDGIQIPKDSNSIYNVNYTAFVVPLVKAVQEQQAMIDNQKKIIEDQRKELNDTKTLLQDMIKRLEKLEEK